MISIFIFNYLVKLILVMPYKYVISYYYLLKMMKKTYSFFPLSD
jgi:hypothetical protein